MTRDEAARVLKYLWIERDENAKSMQQLTKSFFERQEALRIGVAALRGPQPDPETRLVPCVYCGDADDQANLFEENNYAPYSGMESAISINRQQDGRHIVCVDLWKDGNVVADFEIFYCPMCGRKLE